MWVLFFSTLITIYHRWTLSAKFFLLHYLQLYTFQELGKCYLSYILLIVFLNKLVLTDISIFIADAVFRKMLHSVSQIQQHFAHQIFPIFKPGIRPVPADNVLAAKNEINSNCLRQSGRYSLTGKDYSNELWLTLADSCTHTIHWFRLNIHWKPVALTTIII